MRFDEDSILALYKHLLALRRDHTALHAGAWRRLVAPEKTLAYERHFGDERIFVALNLDAAAALVQLPASGRLLVSTQGDRRDETTGVAVSLRGDEGVVILSSDCLT